MKLGIEHIHLLVEIHNLRYETPDKLKPLFDYLMDEQTNGFYTHPDSIIRNRILDPLEDLECSEVPIVSKS